MSDKLVVYKATCEHYLLFQRRQLIRKLCNLSAQLVLCTTRVRRTLNPKPGLQVTSTSINKLIIEVINL